MTNCNEPHLKTDLLQLYEIDKSIATFVDMFLSYFPVQVLTKRTSSIDHTAPIPHALDVEIRRGIVCIFVCFQLDMSRQITVIFLVGLGDGFFPDLIDEALVVDKVDSG